ncbi:MAG: hypothetical protein WCL19_03785 [Verrucomicrobiota bacterium]
MPANLIGRGVFWVEQNKNIGRYENGFRFPAIDAVLDAAFCRIGVVPLKSRDARPINHQNTYISKIYESQALDVSVNATQREKNRPHRSDGAFLKHRLLIRAYR